MTKTNLGEIENYTYNPKYNVVTYPNKTKKIVKTLAEAQEVKAMGGTFKTVYSKVVDK